MCTVGVCIFCVCLCCVYLCVCVCGGALTGDVADEAGGEDAVQHQGGEVAQLEQGHEDVDGGQGRAQRLQLQHHLQLGEQLLLVGRPVAHPAEGEHQLLDHLKGANQRGGSTANQRGEYTADQRGGSTANQRGGSTADQREESTAGQRGIHSQSERGFNSQSHRHSHDEAVVPGLRPSHLAVQVLGLLDQEVGDGVQQLGLPQAVAGHVLGDEGHGVGGDAVHLLRELL